MAINTRELCEQTGATERQINYWCTNNVIEVLGNNPNPGSGYKREFEDKIIPKVKLLVDLSFVFRASIGLDILRWAYNAYDEGSVDVGNGITLHWDGEPLRNELINLRSKLQALVNQQPCNKVVFPDGDVWTKDPIQKA